MNCSNNCHIKLRERTPEERELLKLSNLLKDIIRLKNSLVSHQTQNFYEELNTKIRSLIYKYIQEQQNSLFSQEKKHLHLFYKLFKLLWNFTFMNQQCLINFLFKRIFSFYNSLNSSEDKDILLLDDTNIYLFRRNLEPIIYHCLNLFVNKFLFHRKKSLPELKYLIKYYKEKEGNIGMTEIKNQISEIFFIQLICLEDYADKKTKSLLKDENSIKDFIENKIIELYKFNLEKNDKNNKNENDDLINLNPNENNDMLFLLENDFNEENLHLLRYLRKAIISVFTPVDSNILDFFESLNNYYDKAPFQSIKSNITLDALENLFLNNNIQDVDIKIRNITFLIDIILQKYFNIQLIPEIELLKFPRMNIIMNRLFFEKTDYLEQDKNQLLNAIFEHFIISQFMYNYMKYQVKDPEHYPIEIRNFVIYSYIKISVSYLITNPFSAYITSITYREIIKCLKLEKGFHKQKYNKYAGINLSKSNESELNDSKINIDIEKKSSQKSKRRKSISRNKKKKKKNNKKSISKNDVQGGGKININIDTSLLENYAKIENDSNSKSNLNDSKISFIDEELDKPHKLISKTLFNYLCFIYAMRFKFKKFSEQFETLYSFIDEYIKKNIKSISLDEDWTWILIDSIKFIKNFDLSKTYEKFKIKIEKDDMDTNINLIADLSKKVKYCNTQEHFLILDVIYNILINMKDLPKALKSPKYTNKFKKLNRALSYLSFNINYSRDLSLNMSLINQEVVGDKLFKITNFLFIDTLDEYFWIPKSLKAYKNFNDFIQLLGFKFDKVLYKKSLYSEQFIFGLVAIKKFFEVFFSKKNKSKKDREREQYILSLEYFCKLKIFGVDSIEDLKKMTIIKEYIFKLMELKPDEYDLNLDLNEKVDLLKNILLSGEYDLSVCLFLIFQLIANKKLEDNSNEIKLIIDIFKLMINKEYKLIFNFLLTFYKSIEKYLFDLIDDYVSLKFPENYNFSKDEYSKFLDLFNPKKKLDSKNNGKDIQTIYINFTLIKKELERTGAFYNFLVFAEEMNYPKSVMNLIEKYIFDITREYNIHEFHTILKKTKEGVEISESIKKYLKLYYRAYSHIENNKTILDNYFSNNSLFQFLHKNYNRETKISYNNKNSVNSNQIMSVVDKYFISLDYSILSDNISLIEENIPEKHKNNVNLRIFRFLYNICTLNEDDVNIEQRKHLFFLVKQMERNSKLEILEHNNKLIEINNSMNYSLWLYELSLYLENFEIYLNSIKNNSDFVNNKNQLARKLKNLFINKRKIPHLKRFLFIFEFRRFLFNLMDDKISELYCLLDICKVYKSIYETGISEDEINNFREILIIYMNILIKAEKTFFIGIDKKLILVPLKYYVKYFNDESTIPFETLYQKYQKLYAQYKGEDFFTFKIIILKQKLKAKNGVVGINQSLSDKVEKLGNRSENKNKEGFLLYTDFMLDMLLTNNDKDFDCIKPRQQIYDIRITDFKDNIFKYLKGAIEICVITDKEKYLRKYMPEIINLFFKFNLAYINYEKDNNIDLNMSIESQNIMIEGINKYKYLLNKFRKEIHINKIKIIIPQLMICYQYENTPLYDFAVDLLVSYAKENIDLISFLLSSFLNFKEEDMKMMGIKQYRNDPHSSEKYKIFLSTFSKSKKFVNLIKNKLSTQNRNVLMGYEEFCENLSGVFFESKRMANSSNVSKREMRTKQDILINNVNMTLKNNLIILPTLENVNRCKSFIRNVENPQNNNILFLKELESRIEILSSKEKPMHIRFKVCNIQGEIYQNIYYDFLLKSDVNDITKEIKTFEIIEEINNIFKIKHFDTNESMSLKRYLIVPIGPTIILAEWLNDCISFSSAIEEQSKKDLIYQEEYKYFIKNENNNKQSVIQDSIINEEEKFNILYNYYQYNFFNPNLWYKAKKNYIISTAIWSMIQYLVGLGDRHPGNIMFNKKDGEVVHIDFGYVALKGLSLGVPEIVDFRFTINLRKNLGLFEESGLFNYICVKVLKTFKEYYKTLSARIEYYQFDPLFDSENDNKTFKLFDQNDSFFKCLDNNNVKEKLKNLIIKNKNPENLEKMYVWWSPWA